jgi:phage RecT family recombinase
MPGELEKFRNAELTMGKILAPYEQALGELIPRTGVTPAAFMVSLRSAVTKDEYTFGIASQNPQSVLTAGMKCAIWGHVPGSKHAAIVPYGGKDPKLEAIEQYHGLINRAQRAMPGLVVSSGIVRENDEFEAPGALGEPVRHWYAGRDPFAPLADRGQIRGVYAQARLPNGVFTQAVILNPEQISKIKALSRTENYGQFAGRNRFWEQWPEEMAQKAAIKRIRGLPESSEWRQETDKLLVASDRIATQYNAHVPVMDDESAEYVEGEVE